MAACLTALMLWIVFRKTLRAHMLVVVAVPVSFWPTWASIAVGTLSRPRQEWFRARNSVALCLYLRDSVDAPAARRQHAC